MNIERVTDMKAEELPKLGAVILSKIGGKIVETTEQNSSPLGYGAKLAVVDADNKPYGQVDHLLITMQPNNLIVYMDDGKESAEIMRYAIQKASEMGLGSLAISTDSIAEIDDVKIAVRDFLNYSNLRKVGFYYPISDD